MSNLSRSNELATRYGLRNVSSTWLRQTENYRIENLPGQIAKRDLSSICEGTIPFDVSSAEKLVLELPALVQIEDVINAAADDPRSRAGGPCTLLLRLSDGFQSFGAIELVPLRGRISVKTIPGTKLKLKPGTLFFHGRAMLTPETVEIVGGPLVASANIWGASYEGKVAEQLRAANLRPPGEVSFDTLVASNNASGARDAPLVGLGGIADQSDEMQEDDDSSFWLEVAAAEDVRASFDQASGAGSAVLGGSSRAISAPGVVARTAGAGGSSVGGSLLPTGAEAGITSVDLVTPPHAPPGGTRRHHRGIGADVDRGTVVDDDDIDVIPPPPDLDGEDFMHTAAQSAGNLGLSSSTRPTIGGAPTSGTRNQRGLTSVVVKPRVTTVPRCPIFYLKDLLSSGGQMRRNKTYAVRGFVSEQPRIDPENYDMHLTVEDGSGELLRRAEFVDALDVVGDGRNFEEVNSLEPAVRKKWRADFRRRGRMLNGFFTVRQGLSGETKIVGVSDEPPDGFEAFVDKFSEHVAGRLAGLRNRAE